MLFHSNYAFIFAFAFALHIHYAIVDSFNNSIKYKGRNYYSYFAEVETEAQSGAEICPASHICQVLELTL